jgi:hypothetical protein
MMSLLSIHLKQQRQKGPVFVLETCFSVSLLISGAQLLCQTALAMLSSISIYLFCALPRLYPVIYQQRSVATAGQRSILMKNREGVKAGLNFDDIRNIEIPDVDLAKQQRFSDLTRSIDTLKSSQKNAQNKLNELFLSLQHRAFRGEL